MVRTKSIINIIIQNPSSINPSEATQKKLWTEWLELQRGSWSARGSSSLHPSNSKSVRPTDSLADKSNNKHSNNRFSSSLAETINIRDSLRCWSMGALPDQLHAVQIFARFTANLIKQRRAQGVSRGEDPDTGIYYSHIETRRGDEESHSGKLKSCTPVQAKRNVGPHCSFTKLLPPVKGRN